MYNTKKLFSHTSISLFLLFTFVLSFYFPISFYNSCQNVFRSNLIPTNFDYVEVAAHSTSVSITIDDSKDVREIIDNINNCPRASAAEMSFASPPEGLLILHGVETVEIPFFNDRDLIDIHIIYDGYYISSKISLDA